MSTLTVTCVSAIRICPPCSGTHLDTGYTAEALTGQSRLRDTHRLSVTSQR